MSLRVFLGIALLGATTVQALAEVSYEFNSAYSLVGGAPTDLGQGRQGSVEEQCGLLRFVASPQLKEGLLLRIGAEWERYSFSVPAGAAIPNTLQSTSLVLGLDLQPGESWLLRIEAKPGFYGNSTLLARDISVPFVFGASYLASPELQWVFGLEIDLDGQYPVLPGAGVRWQYSDKWVLNAILPTPRAEYTYSKSLMFYGGFDFKTGSYRMNSTFGTDRNQPNLNNAVLEYMEFRAGVGASWKVRHGWTLEAESGYMPYRKFDYYKTSVNIETDRGAPYGQVSLGASF